MPGTDRSRLRLAAAIHAQLVASQRATRLAELPAESWRRAESLVRQVRRAELHGWQLAANLIVGDLQYALSSLVANLTELRDELAHAHARIPATTLSDVYHELVALQGEFDVVDFSLTAHTLSVRTEPIALAGIQLGPFEIRLHWHRLASETSYRVVALEPNPADSRPGCTHPHVMDEALCEGDGRHAIRQALAAGRLLDFFSLVAGVLRTYNDESPFVELALWHGQSCSDCGSLVDEDERSSCTTCGDSVCDECQSTCGGCGDAHCSHCLADCGDCRDAYCRNCLRVCGECRRSVCETCLNGQERCHNCHEPNQNDSDHSNSPKTAPPAIHSDGLGQALVPA